MTERRAAEAPVGVFDSGVGGLTVLAALTRALPAENFVYLGDTARLPYGTRSADSIRRYSLQAAARLHDSGVKCLVVACNTASAVALDALGQGLDLPAHDSTRQDLLLDEQLQHGLQFRALGRIRTDVECLPGAQSHHGQRFTTARDGALDDRFDALACRSCGGRHG